MRGWTVIWLIVWLFGGKTNADINSQSLTASPGTYGIPPANAICTWAHCRGLCQVQTSVGSSSCPDDVLRTFSYDEAKCRTVPGRSQTHFCIGPASGSKTSWCKPKKNNKVICFPQKSNTETNRDHTEICWNTTSCDDLMQYCSSNAYTDCIYNGSTTSEPPSTLTSDFTTRTQPIASTPGGFTSEHNVTSSLNPPITDASSLNQTITDALDSSKPLAFMIGIIVGSLLISPIFVVILLLCFIRNHRRKKFGVSNQAEKFEMNEDAVYQAIGPELPPNHPTLGKGGNPANQVNTSGSSRSFEVTMEPRHAEEGNLEGSQDTPYFVLESKDEHYQEGINRSNSRGTSSMYINASDTPNIDNITYETGYTEEKDLGNKGHDVTRVYTQLQRNGKEYSQVDDVTVNAEEPLSTCDGSISDRAYMALNVADVDGGDVTGSKEEIEHNGSPLHSRENLVGENDQESSSEVDKTDKQKETIEDNSSEPNISPSYNYQQGSTTFPRPKSLKVSSSGSATPKKSRFLSLKFGSKKRHKLSKKKLKSFCSTDESELCLDLTISSPTSPTEEKEASFFTAAVPLIHAPPQEPQVSEKLSKSQEAIFDDVTTEPFRNRSRSQPIRQTFSPTLCKEYDEIKESWGATYLQVPPLDQK